MKSQNMVVSSSFEHADAVNIDTQAEASQHISRSKGLSATGGASTTDIPRAASKDFTPSTALDSMRRSSRGGRGVAEGAEASKGGSYSAHEHQQHENAVGGACTYCSNSKYWTALNIEPVPVVPKNAATRPENSKTKNQGLCVGTVYS